MNISIIIGFILILVSFGIFLFFNAKSKINKKVISETETSNKKGEEYEHKISEILNKISSDEIKIEHITKGIKGVDFVVEFTLNNGSKSNILIEAKNAKKYSLEWEKKLNDHIISKNNYPNVSKAIIVCTCNKNNRPELEGYWSSKINKKIVIMNDNILATYIKREFSKLKKENQEFLKLSSKDQELKKEEHIKEDLDEQFKSIIHQIKNAFNFFVTKFSTTIDKNLEKIKTMKLHDKSSYKNIDMEKIDNLSKQVKDLTNEIIEELDKGGK